MKIGISQRIEKINSRDEIRDTIDHRVINWLSTIGLIPILIPNSLIYENLTFNKQKLLQKWLEETKLDAIILSGGNNIGEMILRDLTEYYLLDWAEKNNVPVLGICRGMQMMSVYFGGQLEKKTGHVATRHELIFDRNKFLLPKNVNSYHQFTLFKCPQIFTVMATSRDGCIEAIIHKKLSWEGWMWHPEREPVINKIETERFKKLIGHKE